MKIESIQKKCIEKLFVFRSIDGPVPIYKLTGEWTNMIGKNKLAKMLEEMVPIQEPDVEKGIRGKYANLYRVVYTNWYKLDGTEIPFTESTARMRELIDRVVMKILRASTRPSTKEFLYDTLKQLQSRDWSDKQKFVMTCKAYDVSDFSMKKKKASEIGYEDVGIVSGKATQHVMEVGGVYPIYGAASPGIVPKDSNVLAWKRGKYWIVSDIDHNTACKIREDLIGQFIQPTGFSSSGATEYIKVRAAFDAGGLISKDDFPEVK